jgi:type II secretory pathway pseudopilin PulG
MARTAHGERGFTYLGVMFIIALMGLTGAMASVVWATAQRRANERELVFIGQQFSAAIASYQRRPAVAPPRYPRTLEELVRDDRTPTPARHLRKIYVDPITGDSKWGLVLAPDGGIVGVHSLSDREPFPRTKPIADYSPPSSSKTYRDWVFTPLQPQEP